MAFPTGWTRWMTDTVGISNATGFTTQGKHTWAEPVPTACRIERVRKEMKKPNEETWISTAQIHVAGTVTVNIHDRITFSDGTTSFVEAVEYTKAPDDSVPTKVIFT